MKASVTQVTRIGLVWRDLNTRSEVVIRVPPRFAPRSAHQFVGVLRVEQRDASRSQQPTRQQRTEQSFSHSVSVAEGI